MTAFTAGLIESGVKIPNGRPDVQALMAKPDPTPADMRALHSLLTRSTAPAPARRSVTRKPARRHS